MTNVRLIARAARLLDETHNAAWRNYGIYTDQARWTLACWLDGQPMRISYVRKLCDYLKMIART